jgi:hypothetical protein
MLFDALTPRRWAKERQLLGSALGFGLQGGVDDGLDLLRVMGGFASPAGHTLFKPSCTARLRHNLTVW